METRQKKKERKENLILIHSLIVKNGVKQFSAYNSFFHLWISLYKSHVGNVVTCGFTSSSSSSSSYSTALEAREGRQKYQREAIISEIVRRNSRVRLFDDAYFNVLVKQKVLLLDSYYVGFNCLLSQGNSARIAFSSAISSSYWEAGESVWRNHRELCI